MKSKGTCVLWTDNSPDLGVSLRNLHVEVMLPVNSHRDILKKIAVHACPGEDYFVAWEIWNQSCPH